METANEIRSAVKNIRYYTQIIHDLAKQQFDKDFDIGNLVGMAVEPGSKRFDTLGCIQANTEWLNVYCNNIEANVKHAEELDGKLRPEEETEEEKLPNEIKPSQEDLPF